MSKENFRFQAHRGDSAFYPENTLVSYDAAVKEGYQVIEMDSKFTRDVFRGKILAAGKIKIHFVIRLSVNVL